MTLDSQTLLAIAACVRSVEELEVFLFLARHRERYCSPTMVAAETGLLTSAAATALETLASRNLLDVRIGEAVLYKLDPASAEARARVELALQAAWQNRGAVIRSIIRGPSAAHDFADAFRVTRKRRSDG